MLKLLESITLQPLLNEAGAAAGGDGGAPASGVPTIGGGAPAGGSLAPAGGAPGNGAGNGDGGNGGAPAGGEGGQNGAGAAGEGGTPEPVTYDKDWRAAIANGDDNVLTQLSRMNIEGADKDPVAAARHLAAEVVRQRGELSGRAAASPSFPAEGTTEEQAAWREAHDVPAEGTFEAYNIKTPEGYEVSNVEKGLLDDFVQAMHEKNAPGEYVRSAVDEWFKINQAQQQDLNAANDAQHREWDQSVQQELGKDYDNTLAAANMYFEQRITDENVRAEILNAQLPGGGQLAKHPEFIKMAAELAMQNGLGDRIEANSIEAGGKTLQEQVNEIEGWQSSDPARYNLPATQQRLDKLIQLQLSRGEIDSMGNPIRK